MNDLPRQKLCKLIANPKYGRTLCDNPQRCEGLLRDFCGQYRAEIFVLVTALKEGVAGELLKSSQISVPKEIILARLSKRLQDLGMAKKSACWAVNSWALALGINCQLEESAEEAEFQRQELIKNEDYESKLHQYEQEVLRAVEREYPLTAEVRNKLRNVRQSLGIKFVDVGQIEKPILLQREAEYQKQSAAEIRKELEQVKKQQEQESDDEKEKIETSRKFQAFLGLLSGSILIISIMFLVQKEQEITRLDEQVGNLKENNESLSKELHTLRNVRDNVNDLLTRYSSTGYTYLRFCNKTSRRISAARAYWDGNGWRSEGWWSPEAGECTEVYIGDNYRGKVYVYGKFYGENIVADNQWSSGDSSFCTELPGPFDIANSDERDNCGGSGREMVKMSEFPVFPGTNTWNFKD